MKQPATCLAVDICEYGWEEAVESQGTLLTWETGATKSGEPPNGRGIIEE